MARSRRTPYLVALAVAAAVGAACAVGPDDGGGPGGFPQTSAPAPTQTVPGRQEDGTMTEQEFQDDLRGAVDVAESYWSAQFRAAGRQFTPVREIIPYHTSGEVTCAGEPVPANNALYCSDGDFIAYDVDWAVAAFRKIGDAFLYYLLSHEYSHGIQVRLGESFRFTVQQELQADCMAGANIGDSVRAGALNLQSGDLDELRTGLAAVGDAPDQPWFAEGSHGSPEQRTQSFFAGYEKSLGACGLG
jgi:predicted metalloprotease